MRRKRIRTYSIDTDVPMPSSKGRWNFIEQMKVGNSFVVRGKKEYQGALSAMYYRKVTPVVQREGSAYRIWRAK